MDLVAEDVDRIGNNWWGLNLNYNRNSFDEQFFAKTGSELNVSLEYPLGFGTIYSGPQDAKVALGDLVNIPNKNYLKAKIAFEHIVPANNKISFSYFLAAGAATKDLGSTQYFTVGGLKSTARSEDIHFPGMLPREISAQEFVMAHINLRCEIINNLFFNVSGGAIDYASEFEFLSFVPVRGLVEEDVVFGGNLVFSYNSIIGPIEFGYGRSSLHKESRWFFTAGFPF